MKFVSGGKWVNPEKNLTLTDSSITNPTWSNRETNSGAEHREGKCSNHLVKFPVKKMQFFFFFFWEALSNIV